MAYQPPKKPIRTEYPLPAAPLVNEFTLGDEERFLFDLWAQEHTHILGTAIEFWSLDVKGSKRDALYDEPVKRVWDGPFKMKGYIEYPPGEPEAREEGFRNTWRATCWISRKDFEDTNCPAPNEGDSIRIWNVPFFQAAGVDNEDVPGRGYFFDVTNVDEDGHLWDQSTFVGFRMEIKRNTEFTPERRIDNK